MWQYYLFVCLFLICLFIKLPPSSPPEPSAVCFPPSSGTNYKHSWRHFHKTPTASGHDLGRTPASQNGHLSIFLAYSVLKLVYHLKEILAKFTGKRNRDSIFWWGGRVTHTAPLIWSLRTLWKKVTESWWQKALPFTFSLAQCSFQTRWSQKGGGSGSLKVPITSPILRHSFLMSSRLPVSNIQAYLP